MFYPCKKQSRMGQTHTALRTGAKSKSVLLSEQLTQINNYQTEGLLVHIFFPLWHLLYWPSTAANPASAPDLDGAAVIPSSPGWRWARTGSPSTAPRAENLRCRGSLSSHSSGRAKRAGAAGASRAACLETFWNAPLGRSWETWRHSLCCWDAVNSRINFPVKGAIWVNSSCSQVIFGKSCTPAPQWIFWILSKGFLFHIDIWKMYKYIF